MTIEKSLDLGINGEQPLDGLDYLRLREPEISEKTENILGNTRKKIVSKGNLEIFLESFNDFTPERGILIAKIGEKETDFGFVTRKSNLQEYIKFYSLDEYGHKGELLEITENNNKKNYYFVNEDSIEPIISLSGIKKIIPQIEEFIENLGNGIPVFVSYEDNSSSIIIKNGNSIDSKIIDSNEICYNKEIYDEFINGERGEKVGNNIVFFLNGVLMILKNKYCLSKDGKIKEKGFVNNLKKGISIENLKEKDIDFISKYFEQVKFDFVEDIN